MASETKVQVTGGGSADCGNGWDPVRHDGPRSRWIARLTVAPADEPDGEVPDAVRRSPQWLSAVQATPDRTRAERDTSTDSDDPTVDHADAVDTAPVMPECPTRAVRTNQGDGRVVRHPGEPRETTPVGRQDTV